MTETYHPSEEKIQAVIDRTGGDPRKLAIAYLRAQRRTRSAEAAFDMMEGLQDATMGIVRGDLGDAGKALNRALERAKAKT